MNTIRGRLQWALAASLSALLLVSSLCLYLVLRAALVAEFDDALRAEARALTSLVEYEHEEDHDGETGMDGQGRGKVDFEASRAVLAGFADPKGSRFLEIRDASGGVVWRSPSLGAIELRVPGPQASGPPAPFDLELPGSREGRAVVLVFLPQGARSDAPPVTLAVARDASPLARRLRALLAVLGIGTLVEVAAAVWIGRALVGKGLRPLRDVGDAIGSLSAESLDVRLDPASLPGELAPVVAKFNGLLARLEASFARERRFSADLAHELRTPIAGMRALLEVALARPRAPEAYREAVRDVLDVVLAMGRIVEKMLELARAERGDVSPEFETVAIPRAVERAWQPLRPAARERGLRERHEIPETLAVRTDPNLLHIALSNVLENACEHGDAGGAVAVRAEPLDGGARIRISNPASRLSPEDLTHVFERFWRGDRSRTAAGLHAGLGLDLARHLVRALGGAMHADLRDGVFSIEIDLP